MNEFDLIEKYFNWQTNNPDFLGVGDDCALISIPEQHKLATSVDTLIEGVHFPSNTSAADVAHKALAVNLSDLAAMGSTPLYFTLALTLPNIDESWLKEFSSSLKAVSEKYNISLLGGDTTKGRLSITINVTGALPRNQALLRSGANVDDIVFVSNTIGDAALAWQKIQQDKTPGAKILKKFNTPEPQVLLGQKLLGVANSCIDISDGLEQDLSHILNRSKLGARIDISDIPLSDEVLTYVENTKDWCLPLAGGDDYELCFTVSKNNIDQLELITKELDIKLTKIGVITKNQDFEIVGLNKTCTSYQHF